MELKPVNQRLKFLLEKLGLSARAFSEMIGEKSSNTQNYVGARSSMPGADYLEKVVRHFESVNPIWLLTGEGEPFKEGFSPNHNQTNISGKKNNIAVAGTNNGRVDQTTNLTIDECTRDLSNCRTELDKAQQRIESLEAQLVRADTLAAAQERTIDLLKVAFTRPN